MALAGVVLGGSTYRAGNKGREPIRGLAGMQVIEALPLVPFLLGDTGGGKRLTSACTCRLVGENKQCIVLYYIFVSFSPTRVLFLAYFPENFKKNYLHFTGVAPFLLFLLFLHSSRLLLLRRSLPVHLSIIVSVSGVVYLWQRRNYYTQTLLR